MLFYLIVLVIFNCMKLSSAIENNEVIAAHGCLMTIAWVIFASNGILLIRYYSHLSRLIYVIHVIFAVLVQLASIAGFLIILGYYFKWKWIGVHDINFANNYKLGLAHSIFGITAISVALLQIISALMHVRDKSKKHYIAKYIHRFGGAVSFGLASIKLNYFIFYYFNIFNI